MTWLLIALAVAGLLAVGALVATTALGAFVERARAAKAMFGPTPPREETFLEALRRVPLGLVIALDVLDLLLDFFATPIVWVVLDRLGYRALRKVAVVEALVPFTQAVPVMTICWIFARATDPSRRAGRGAGGGGPGVRRVPNLASGRGGVGGT